MKERLKSVINTHPTYTFLLGYRNWTEELASDVIQWCETMFSGQFWMLPGDEVKEPWIQLEIESDKDALIFRLRWSGEINKIYNKSSDLIYSNTDDQHPAWYNK